MLKRDGAGRHSKASALLWMHHAVTLWHPTLEHERAPKNLSPLFAFCRNMPQYPTAFFDAVVDKGTLDALMCGDQADSNVDDMLQEASRWDSAKVVPCSSLHLLRATAAAQLVPGRQCGAAAQAMWCVRPASGTLKHPTHLSAWVEWARFCRDQ